MADIEDPTLHSDGDSAAEGREALLPSSTQTVTPRFWRLAPLSGIFLLVGLPLALLSVSRHSLESSTVALVDEEELPLTPGCTANFQNCIASRCCLDPNSQCFAKDRAWAVCKPACTPGIDSSEAPELQTPWSCAMLRPQSMCSGYGENCTKTKCCKDASSKCYYKDPGWAQCLPNCEPGQVHSDEPRSLRTPWSCVVAGSAQEEQLVAAKPTKPMQPAKPVSDRQLPHVIVTRISSPVSKTNAQVSDVEPSDCVRMYGNCTEKKCCTADPANSATVVGCYKRDSLWSECRESCPKDESWECYNPDGEESKVTDVALKAQHSGLMLSDQHIASRSSPTLYCLSLMLPWGNELSLIRTQLAKGVGIFGCDDWSVVSNESVVLSPGPPVLIRADVMPGSLHCNFGGEYHTALNSKIFYRVWKKVVQIGRFENYDWTVKMDPDAVLLPSRLRKHTAGRNPNAAMYLNNCFEGLHGPIEVMSLGGMKVFAKGLEHCRKSLEIEWMTYGEDVWLRRCFGLLGLARMDDYDVLREKACKPFKDPIPCTYSAVAFHPLKTPKAYFKCLSQASIVEAEEPQG